MPGYRIEHVKVIIVCGPYRLFVQIRRVYEGIRQSKRRCHIGHGLIVFILEQLDNSCLPVVEEFNIHGPSDSRVVWNLLDFTQYSWDKYARFGITCPKQNIRVEVPIEFFS